MKKLLIVCLMLAGWAGMAQEQADRPSRRAYLTELSPEQMATLSSKRLALALDLTEEQRGKVMELHLEKATERKAMKEARAEEKDKDQSPEDRFERINERLDRQIAYKSSMKDILSEDQYARWEKFQMRKGREGHKGHRRHAIRTRK